jgi:hypothetical protein
MNIRIFALPYDSGQRAVHMGYGPGHWLRPGIADVLHVIGRLVGQLAGER